MDLSKLTICIAIFVASPVFASVEVDRVEEEISYALDALLSNEFNFDKEIAVQNKASASTAEEMMAKEDAKREELKAMDVRLLDRKSKKF